MKSFVRGRASRARALIFVMATTTLSCAAHDTSEPLSSSATAGAPRPTQVIAALSRGSVLAARLDAANGALARVGGGLVGTSRAGAPFTRARVELGATADAAWTVAVDGASPGLRATLRPLGHARVPLELDEGRAFARDVAPSTDLVYAQAEGGAELLYVLRDERAPTDFDFELERGDDLVEVRADGEGGLSLRDARGKERMFVERPLAIDAEGTRREASLDRRGARLRVHLDARGLVRPIVLDPYVGTARWARRILEPTRREGAGLAALGSTLVLFGGADRFAYDDTWTWDGAAFREQRTAHAPPARSDMAIATLGGRVVVFGGADADGRVLDDTWAFDGSDWTQLAPAHHPSARAGANAAAIAGGKLVLFGGVDATSATAGDTWEFDGNDWAPRPTTTAPTGGSPAAMTAFGGEAWRVSASGTWSWDGARWTSRAPASATPTSGGALALGGVGATLALVDFGVAPDFRARAFAWDGGAWIEQPLGAPPPSRTSASAASFQGALVVFGGAAVAGTTTLADAWSWDGAAFTHLVSDALPSKRARGAMAADGDAALLFGGADDVALDDTWRWDGATWTRLSPATRPPARQGAALVERASGALLFGGRAGDGASLGDTWTWRAGDWHEEPGAGPPPSAQPEATRVGAGSLLRAVSGTPAVAETWLFGDAGWTKLQAASEAPTGFGILASYGAGALFVDLADGAHWAFEGAAWSRSASPLASELSGVDVLDGRGVDFDRFALALLTRSLTAGEIENAAFAWDGTRWARLAIAGLPPRTDYALARRGNVAVLFGGLDEDGAPSNDTFELDLSLASGATCQRDAECETGHCAQGVCCSSACTGATESCALPATKGTCITQLAACADATTLVGADQQTHACTPYLCAAGACLAACATSSDCAGGFVCDTVSRTCVDASAPSSPPPASGCALGATSGRAPLAIAVSVLACAMLRRRRHSKRSA